MAKHIYFPVIHTLTSVLWISCTLQRVQHLFCVCVWVRINKRKVGDQIAGTPFSVLEDPWWTTALVFTSDWLHYFSIYRETVGRWSPTKFDQRDYNPPCTISFKPHLCCLQGPQYITPSVQCIYQSPSLWHCRSPTNWGSGESTLTKPGSRPSGVKRMWSTADGVEMTPQMGSDSSRGVGSKVARGGLKGSYLMMHSRASEHPGLQAAEGHTLLL